MTQQEQFEADYLVAYPNAASYISRKDERGSYFHVTVSIAFDIWLQQAKRHEAEKAELVAALKPFAYYACEDGCGICYNCLAKAAIAKYEVKS